MGLRNKEPATETMYATARRESIAKGIIPAWRLMKRQTEDDGGGELRLHRQWSQTAQRLWEQARPISGTIAEKYLREACVITIKSLPSCLRFTPSLKHPECHRRFPAMLAKVEQDNACLGICITWLEGPGTGKPPGTRRGVYGSYRGGAVRLTSPGEVLAIAERVETALAIFEATGLATWAALEPANLTILELPEIVKEVVICPDNDLDSAAERAALLAARRFQREGRRTRIVISDAIQSIRLKLRRPR